MTARTATAQGEGEMLKQYIRDIPDFPQPGVLYRDITPLLNDPTAFRTVIDTLVAHYRDQNLGGIAAVESRGFLFAAPMAYALGVPFIVGAEGGEVAAQRPLRDVQPRIRHRYAGDAHRRRDAGAARSRSRRSTRYGRYHRRHD